MALSTLEAAQVQGAIALLQSILGQSGASSAPAGGGVADADDLDGKYGDPLVRFKPKDWQGENFKGCNMSACSPEFLDQVASSLDYFAKRAEKNNEKTSGGKPLAPFNRRDAARARGWAARLRSGWKPAGFVAPVEELDGSLDADPVTGGVDPFAEVSELTDDDIGFAWLLPFALPLAGLLAAGALWT